MASTAIHHRRFFFFSILLGFLAVAANARPCKTIIFISSASSSFRAENPNFLIQNPRFLTFYITEDREINPKPFISYKDHQFFQDRRPVKPSRFPVNFDASVGSSIRDRTLDIMSIVGALLFGVGCGALTAATMYLIWFLFSPNRFNFDGDSDGDSDDDESKDVYGDVSPKKMGYVAIQADTFVSPPAKQVYKSGSVGRSLDITRFNSYHELREELGQMFGIEGFLEDPQRSGWQLVFVDRENDVLLLGDDPWDAFVINVWYIKILSPEDVQKLGKQELEPFIQNAGERMNSSGNDDRDLLSGLHSLGSLEY